MNILILGAGTVGYSIAEILCNQNHSVTIVEAKHDMVGTIDTELDVRVVPGSASEASVLFQAGVNVADVCLAVTGNDEVNLVAASMAGQMGCHRTIARVYSPIFRDLSTFDYQRHFGIDHLISLENLTAMELAREIRSPGSVFIENFAGGQLEIQEVVVTETSNVSNKSLMELALPNNVRIGSIYRRGKMWIPKASDVLEQHDRLGIVGVQSDIDRVRGLFQKGSDAKLRVMIAGGGETGYHLAQVLQSNRYQVTILESDSHRCKILSDRLSHVDVLQGDGTRRKVIEEERVARADVFVACTGNDDGNIMAGLEAKDLGAEKIMAVVGRSDNANILTQIGIDRAVSQREVLAKQVNGYLEGGAVISRMELPGEKISVLEIEVMEGVAATQRTLLELDLPPACLIAAVSRQDFVSVPKASTQLQTGDVVVAFMEDHAIKKSMKFFN